MERWRTEYPKHHPRFAYERAEMKRKVDEAEGKPVKALSAWCKEADECNLDYGTYRTLVELHGKTFEELKAQAETRCLPTHSRINAINKI